MGIFDENMHWIAVLVFHDLAIHAFLKFRDQAIKLERWAFQDVELRVFFSQEIPSGE